MSNNPPKDEQLYDWLDFGIRVDQTELWGLETKPLLENVAGVKFSDNQFHALMQAIAQFVAALCTEPPKKHETKSFLRRLSKLRRCVDEITEILKLEDPPIPNLLDTEDSTEKPSEHSASGLLESLRMNVYPLRDQGVSVEALHEALQIASQHLAQLEEGVNQSLSSQPGRRKIQEFQPFLHFCSQVREIWLEAGGREQASGYYCDAATGKWKGDLGRLIKKITGSYSEPTGQPILVVSDSAIRGALRNVSRTNKKPAQPD